MANVVEGLVAVVMKSKFGDDMRVKLEDGDWYSASPDMARKIDRGATVKLKVERKGKNVWIQAVKELEAAPADSKGSSGGGNRGSGRSYTPDPAREASIHYQSSRKDAIAVLTVLVENGLVSLGTKKAEKEAVFLAKLDILTAQFHEDIGTLGAVTRVGEQADESEEFDADEEFTDEPDGDDFEDDGDDDF